MSKEAKSVTKIAGGIGCLVVGLGFVILSPGLLLGFMLASSSERTVYSRAESPDGSREARVQFQDCGAPCGFAKTVYVRRSWLANDSGWFSCRAFQGDGSQAVRLEWIADDYLVIHHGFAPRQVQEVAASCGAVTITDRYDPMLAEDEV